MHREPQQPQGHTVNRSGNTCTLAETKEIFFVCKNEYRQSEIFSPCIPFSLLDYTELGKLITHGIGNISGFGLFCFEPRNKNNIKTGGAFFFQRGESRPYNTAASVSLHCTAKFLGCGDPDSYAAAPVVHGIGNKHGA